MPQNLISADRDQALLLAPDLREWLPDEHLAWFVIETVASLDLGTFYARYRLDGTGRAAHDPELMVALLLYGYAIGVRSSRKLERRCHEDIAFRVICANHHPDHTTISRFRRSNEEALAELFGQLLGLCERADLLAGEALAVDSTKLWANASGEANRSYEQIAGEILADAAQIDAAEDELYGDRRGDEVLPELRTAKERREWIKRNLDELKTARQSSPPPSDRDQRLAECAARLEGEQLIEERAHAGWRASREHAAEQGLPSRGRKPDPATGPTELARRRINTTDPDSAQVKDRRSFLQGYNAQAACTERQIIVACDLVATNPDGGQLEPLVDQAERHLEAAGAPTPVHVLADSGYWSSSQIGSLEARGFQPLVPPDARAGRANRFRKGELAERQRALLEEPLERERYLKRQAMIEPAFAQIKANRRIDRFLRRGISACRSEWSLICTTHNLLKLFSATRGPLTA